VSQTVIPCVLGRCGALVAAATVRVPLDARGTVRTARAVEG
jgi:hypothetical protein